MTHVRHTLVTGGAGFIGSHLVDSLLAGGERVTVLDNFDPFYPRRDKQSYLATAARMPGFRLIEGDVRDPTALARVPDDPIDVVVHLAARAGVRTSIQEPMQYHDVNVRGTHLLLEFARERRIPHFVLASSSSVYGTNPRVPWREEDGALRPISPYASSKACAELLGHVYASLHAVRFIALRFFTVYGPRQRPDLAIRKFIDAMLGRRSVPVFGDDGRTRDYTYITDIVEGIRAAMLYRDSSFEIVNLGSGRPVSTRALLEELAAVTGERPLVERLPEQAGDVPHTYASLEKARALLGYAPRTTLRRGLIETLRWCRSHRAAVAPAVSDRESRISTASELSSPARREDSRLPVRGSPPDVVRGDRTAELSP